MNIPYLNLHWQQQQIKNQLEGEMLACMNDADFILGNRLKQFEETYAKQVGSKYAIGVGNGFDALKIALKSVGVKPGDEVIVPANTYIATWMAVSACGAIPVPVEPDAGSCNIDSDLIVSMIRSRTKAIVPVHLYGRSCAMHEVCSIAAAYGLQVVEDNAQAHLAIYQGKMTGNWGNANATSFYPGKNLGAFGDGGAITTNDPTIDAWCRNYRNYGSHEKYIHNELGENSRLDEIHAGILNVKLTVLKQVTETRIANATFLNTHLKKLNFLKLPIVKNEWSHVYHVYQIQCEDRDQLKAWLFSKGIHTMIHYPIAPHLQKAYTHLGYQEGDFPITEKIAKTTLSLPIYPGLTERHLNHIVSSIYEYYSVK